MARHLERHLLRRQGALGAHDALGDGRLGLQERARDLVGGQAAQQAQGQRDPRVRAQHRVAGHEDQPQQVIANVVAERVAVVRKRQRQRCQLAAPLRMLPRHPLVLAQHVDGAVARGGHQPRSGIVRYALHRPALQRGQPGVLDQFFGPPHVAAQHACQAGDQGRRFHAPEGVQSLRQRGIHAGNETTQPGAASISMWATSHRCPSGSWKLRWYMKP